MATDAAREAFTEPLCRYPIPGHHAKFHRISLRSKGGSSPCSPAMRRTARGSGSRLRRPFRRARLVQLEQARQDLLIRHLRGPAIGGRHRRIQLLVHVVEPCRPLVVQLGSVRFLSSVAHSSSRGRMRSGKPGTTSGTRTTRSGGFSQFSRSSFSRLATAAIRCDRGSSAKRQPECPASALRERETSRTLSMGVARPIFRLVPAAEPTTHGSDCAECRRSCHRHGLL